MTLRIGLLGSFEVTGPGGEPVDLGSPRQRAVLALLAIDAGRVVPLERIVDRLWGDDPPARAEGTVHAYISNLRRALEPDRPARSPSKVLVSRSPGYVLAVPPESIDAVVFETMVAESRTLIGTDPAAAGVTLRQALDMWRGPALSDFTYEAFATSEIARLEELRLEATELRVGADLAAGMSGELVGELERLVAEHPLRERLWGHLMLALYRSGRQAEALRAYGRCRDQLVEELGIEPGAELRALEEAILQQDPALLAPQRPTAGPPPVAQVGEAAEYELDLVGRDVEMAAFETALAAASRGRGSVLLIEGEPGIGKTRLLQAMQLRAAGSGIPAAPAHCVEVGGTPPFWPWLQLWRGVMAAHGVDAVLTAAGPHVPFLAPVLPDLGAASGAPPIDAPPHRVAEGILAAMRELTRERPQVLLIDDLYGADPDSLSVLTLVASGIAGLGLVIVGSYRTTDVPTGHPLAEALAQMTRVDQVGRLRLKRLDVDELGELVLQVSGVEVDRDVVAALHARTGGNAFFAVELVRLLAQDGNLADAGRVEAPVPQTVRDVLRQRLARLGDETLRLLRAASVCGRRWDLDVVAAVLGIPLGEALDHADLAVAAGIIAEEDTPGAYRFSHVLVADTIALGIGSLRRAQFHHDVAVTLEARPGGRPSSWVDIAHHAVEAVPVTGAAAAVEPLARAGHEALAAHAHELAERLFTRRLELVESLPPTPERDEAEIDALLDLSLVWISREGYQSRRVVGSARRLLDLAAGLEDDTTVGSRRLVAVVLPAFQARASQEIVSGDVRAVVRTVALLDEVATLDPDPDPMLSVMAHLNGAMANIHAGDAIEAARRAGLSETVLDVLDPERDRHLMIPLQIQLLAPTHHAFAGWARWLVGERDQARRDFTIARRSADAAGHAFSVAFVTSVETLVAAMEDDPDWAAASIAWSRAYPAVEDFALHVMMAAAAEAWVEGRRGDTAAASRLRGCIATLETMGALVCHTEYWGMAAQLELMHGDPVAALEAADRGLDQVEGRGEGYWHPELERLRALALRELGRDAEAEEALDRAAVAAAGKGIVPLIERIRAVPRVAPGVPDAR